MTKLKVTTQMVCNQNKIIKFTVRKQRWRKAVIKDKVTCKDSTKIALMSSCLIWNKIYYPKNLTRNFRKNLVRSSKWKDRKKSSCGALCAFWRAGPGGHWQCLAKRPTALGQALPKWPAALGKASPIGPGPSARPGHAEGIAPPSGPRLGPEMDPGPHSLPPL